MSYPVIYVILYINYISIKSALFLSILKRIGKITYLLVGRYIPSVWVHSAIYRLTLKWFTSRTSGLNDTSFVSVRDFGHRGSARAWTSLSWFPLLVRLLLPLCHLALKSNSPSSLLPFTLPGRDDQPFHEPINKFHFLKLNSSMSTLEQMLSPVLYFTTQAC